MSPHCPYCNKEMDANFSIEDEKYDQPNENDLSVCAYCGEISILGKDAESLRKIDDVDKLIIDKETLQLSISASRHIKFRKVQAN